MLEAKSPEDFRAPPGLGTSTRKVLEAKSDETICAACPAGVIVGCPAGVTRGVQKISIYESLETLRAPPGLTQSAG